MALSFEYRVEDMDERLARIERLFERIRSTFEAILVLALIYLPVTGITEGLEGSWLRAAAHAAAALITGFCLARLHDSDAKEFRERAARLREELGRRQ